MPSLESYWPTPWIFGCTGHCHSMVMNRIVPNPGGRLHHERVPTADGGIIALESLYKLERGKPTVLVVHGICSSVDTNYMRHTLLEAHSKGFNGVGVLCRGCGDLPLATGTPWNASQHSDISDALKEIHSRIRIREGDDGWNKSEAPGLPKGVPPIVLMGWSIGATMSGLWACEHGKGARTEFGVVGVALLCASFDFFASLENFELDCCVRQSYHAHIVGLLKDYYTRHSDQLNDRLKVRYRKDGMWPHEDWQVAPSAPWGTKDVFTAAADEAAAEAAKEVGVPLPVDASGGGPADGTGGASSDSAAAATSPPGKSDHLAQEKPRLRARTDSTGTGGEQHFRRILSSGNIRELDASFTIPLMEGLKDPFEYYAATSLQHKLAAQVRVPVLVLHAEDDPVCVARGIPLSAPFLNELVMVVRTREGGHIAWREGCCPWGRGWGERTAMEFAAAAVEGAREGWDLWAAGGAGCLGAGTGGGVEEGKEGSVTEDGEIDGSQSPSEGTAGAAAAAGRSTGSGGLRRRAAPSGASAETR